MVARSPLSAARPGICRLIVAVLVLAARLLGAGPDTHAHAATVGLPGLEGMAICWASDAPADQHPPQPPAHGHDCLLCPACHLAGPAVLPVADQPVPVPTLAPPPGHAAPPPPATGPPHAARVAAPPTGPPGHPA